MNTLTPDISFRLSDKLFVEAIRETHGALGRPIAVGLCGAQGSGKSTTAARLAEQLGKTASVVVCSIDDFYLPRQARLRLARTVHPLLETRGVPGTHDVALIEACLDALLTPERERTVSLPMFDKRSDDRKPEVKWVHHAGEVDIVLLEGWCVGARPQNATALSNPINDLERREDKAGRWRQFVNEQLSGDYARLFRRLDLKLMLRAPSFKSVHRWRSEQEAGLILSSPCCARPVMDDAALSRFIAHYQRLTEWILEDEPADLIADLNADRTPLGWRMKWFFSGKDLARRCR